jgi:hypothetical protein
VRGSNPPIPVAEGSKVKVRIPLGAWIFVLCVLSEDKSQNERH